MTKKGKLLAKILNNSKNVSLKKIELILISYEFEQETFSCGSHVIWKNYKENISFVFPRKNLVKEIYVKQLIKILKNIFCEK